MGNARGALGVGARTARAAQRAQVHPPRRGGLLHLHRLPQPSEDIDRSGADPAEQRGARGAGRTEAEFEQSLSAAQRRQESAQRRRTHREVDCRHSVGFCDVRWPAHRATWSFGLRLFYQ